MCSTLFGKKVGKEKKKHRKQAHVFQCVKVLPYGRVFTSKYDEQSLPARLPAFLRPYNLSSNTLLFSLLFSRLDGIVSFLFALCICKPTLLRIRGSLGPTCWQRRHYPGHLDGGRRNGRAAGRWKCNIEISIHSTSYQRKKPSPSTTATTASSILATVSCVE